MTALIPKAPVSEYRLSFLNFLLHTYDKRRNVYRYVRIEFELHTDKTLRIRLNYVTNLAMFAYGLNRSIKYLNMPIDTPYSEFVQGLMPSLSSRFTGETEFIHKVMDMITIMYDNTIQAMNESMWIYQNETN